MESRCERKENTLLQRYLDAPSAVRIAMLAVLVLFIVFLGRYGIVSDSRFIYENRPRKPTDLFVGVVSSSSDEKVRS